MIAPKILLVLAALLAQSQDDGLDGLSVRIVESLTHFNHGGDGLTLGVEVTNSTTTPFQYIMFDCTGYVGGLPVSQGMGIAETVGANSSVFSRAGLYHFQEAPKTATCRITKAYKYQPPFD